jgi:hypothetical protein
MGWDELAHRQAGVITRAQLLEHKRASDAIQYMLATKQVVPIHRGVYLVRGAPLTYEAELWAAVLATDGVLGFATAAHLWGILDRPASMINVVAARGPHNHTPSGVKVHRIDLRPTSVQRHNGLPVTTRKTTALDHLGRLPAVPADGFADRALQQGWITRHDIQYRFRSEPGRTGNVTLRRIFDQTSDGAAAASERVVHQLLHSAGVTGWRPNLDVWHDGVLVGVIDIGFEKQRVAIEIDGWAFHVTPERFQRDRTRANNLIALGWTVLRFTWADITQRPGQVVATVRRLIAAAA